MCMYIGHSIGAYIALEVLSNAKHLVSECTSVVLLMPFIAWKQLPTTHKLFLNLVSASEGECC